MTDHPITPPPELVQQWRDAWIDQSDRSGSWVGEYIATQAARWGADTELEACCAWMAARYGEESHAMALLRTARRPKPPSLKELALATLQKVSTSGYPCNLQKNENWDTIRRALEQLDD